MSTRSDDPIHADPLDGAGSAPWELEDDRLVAVGQMARAVAHDLHNLLTVIFGFASCARSGLAAGHPSLSSLDRIEQAAEQASTVIRMLEGCGLTAQLRAAPVNVDQLAADAVRLSRRLLPPSVEVVLSPEPAAAAVLADPELLRLAAVSLMLVAVKAADPRCRSRLQVKADAPRDGVPAVRFSLKLEPAGEPAGPRLAAGKAQAGEVAAGVDRLRRLITPLGGRLECSLEPGAATLTMAFPPAPPTAHDPGAAARPETPRGKGQLVLLAEGHDYLREITATLLRSAGYEVRETADGLAFIEAARKEEEQVRLVILESDLPHRTGLECLRGVRTAGLHAPAIVITHAGDPGLADAGPLKAVQLRKPSRTSELLALVSRMLDAEGG